jgi:hypothetical protein
MMSKSFFAENVLVIFHHLRARLKQIGKSEVALQFEDSQLPTELFTHQELTKAFNAGQLHFVNDTEAPSTNVQLTPESRIEKHRRDRYVKAINEMVGPNSKGVGGFKKRIRAIAKASKELGDTNPPSPAILGEWCKAKNEKMHGAAHNILAPQKRTRESKFTDEVMLCALEAIDEQISGKSPDKVNYKQLEQRVSHKIKALNQAELKAPKYGWIKSKFKSVIWDKLLKSGLKSTQVKMLYRNAVRLFKTHFPLERVEADGVYLQIGLVDDDGNYLGAVTLIFIIDVHTRCILGYSMRMGRGESSSAVIHAIRHALCPKAEGSFHTKRNNKWPYYGVFSIFVGDGGSAFISKITQTYLLRVCGTIVETVAVASGWLKPFIERFNLTLRVRFASRMPGYVGPMEDQKKLEYSIEENAILTVTELKEHLDSWIVDDYHQTPHSGLSGKTPAEAWQEALDDGWYPELPAGLDKVALPFGKSAYPKVLGKDFHIGVQIENIQYNDEDGRIKDIGLYLRSKDLKPVVYCEYSDCDVSSISVLDPRTDEMFIAQAKDSDIVPEMTREEYRIKHLKKKELMAREVDRPMDDDKNLEQKHKELNKRNNGKKRKKQRNALPENFQDEIEQQEAEEAEGVFNKPSSSVSDLDNPAKTFDFDNIDSFESD